VGREQKFCGLFSIAIKTEVATVNNSCSQVLVRRRRRKIQGRRRERFKVLAEQLFHLSLMMIQWEVTEAGTARQPLILKTLPRTTR